MEFLEDPTQDHIDKTKQAAQDASYAAYTAKGGSYEAYTAKPEYEAYNAGVYKPMSAPPRPADTPLFPHSKTVGDKLMLGIGQKREQWDANYNVKYIEGDTRKKYEVVMGSQMRRRGDVFDTVALVKHFKGKDRTKPNKEGKARAEIAPMYEPTMDKSQMDTWSDEGLIWIWSDDGKFFSHVPKAFRFHHSSFVAGGDVQGAGQWIVKDGRLMSINPMSGHYMPTLNHFHKSVLAMSAAWHKNTTVMLWDTTDKKWVEVPVTTFADEPAGGGRYKAHPDAQ